MADNMKTTAYELRKLKAQRQVLKATLAQLEIEIAHLDQELRDSMKEQGIESFTVDNTCFAIKEKLVASTIKEYMPELVNAARENGHEDLIRTYINAATLSAFLTKHTIAHGGALPDWIEGYVNISVKSSISITEAP